VYDLNGETEAGCEVDLSKSPCPGLSAGPRTKKAATGAAFFGLGSRVGEVNPSGIFEESMFRSLRSAVSFD